MCQMTKITAEFYLDDGDLMVRLYKDGEAVDRMKDLKLTEEQALEMSIQKWEAIERFIEQGEEVLDDNGYHTCALCSLYLKKFNCKGCPVKEYTVYGGCDGTPYEEIVPYLGDPMLLELASEELEFLKGLRKEA